MVGQQIDRDKSRAAVRRMRSEYVFYMLHDAITLLPESKLRKLIAHRLMPADSLVRRIDSGRVEIED